MTKAQSSARCSRGGWLKVLALVLIGVSLSAQVRAAEVPPLTTVSGNPRLPGKFIWADLVTDDGSKAMTFYAQLFGWRFLPTANYYVALNDSRPVAGIFQKSRPSEKAQPRWFGYISVPNVKKAESVALKNGGRIIQPRTNLPTRGEQAVFADPEGALFGVMRSVSGDPEDFLAAPGDWVWIQLLSHDARKASEFYRAVAGYAPIENTEADRLNDYILTSKGYARATIRNLPAQRADVIPTWLPYVRVQDVSQVANKAKQLGGTVLVEPKPSLLDGKVAVIADPTGAAIGILSWLPSEKKGNQ